MSNLFKSAAQRALASPFVIVITLVFAALLVISIGLSIEDYMTSLRGYELLPTTKANAWVLPLVALLPQVGQIAFMYGFAQDTRRRWSLLVTGGLPFFDVLTDVYFKAHGQALWVWVIALIESEALYTLGSEMALVFALGMLMELMPHTIAQSGRLLHALFNSVGVGDAPDERPSAREPRQGQWDNDPFKLE